MTRIRLEQTRAAGVAWAKGAVLAPPMATPLGDGLRGAAVRITGSQAPVPSSFVQPLAPKR